MFSQGNHLPQIRPPPFPQSQPNPPQLTPFPGPPPPLMYQPQYNSNMPPQHLISSFFHQPTYLPPPLKTPYSQPLPPPPPRMHTLPPPPPAHLSHGNALYYTPPPPPPPPPPLREIPHVQVPSPPNLPPPPLPPLPPVSPPPMPSPPPTQKSSGDKGLNDATNDTDDILICTNDNEVHGPKNKYQAVAKESDDCKSEKCLSLEGQENQGSKSLELDGMVTSHIDNIANRSPNVSPVVSDMDMEDDVSEPIANSDDGPRKISAKEINTSSSSGDLGKIKTSPVPDRTDGPSESKADYTDDVKCLPVLSRADSPVLASPDAAGISLDNSEHKSIKDVSSFCLIQGYASEEIEEKSESLDHSCPSNIEVVQEDEERNDKALNCEPSPGNCEKNSAKEVPPAKKHSAQEVDEFGRRRRKDTVDSDSDDAHFNKRRRNRRNVSRSRSPREKRYRHRSPSPRRREKRGRSHSWSPDRSRQRNSLSKRGDKAQACMDFNRGKCYRGASCRFLHHGATQHTNKKQYLDIPLDSKLEKPTLSDMNMKDCNDASKVDSARTEKQHMDVNKDVTARGARIIPPISSQEAINIVKEPKADEAPNVSKYKFVVEPQISVPSSTSCVPLNLNDTNFHPYRKVFNQVEKAQVSIAAEASKSGPTNEPLISVPSYANFNNVNHQQTPPVTHSHPYIASDNPNMQFAASYQFQPTPSTYTYYPPVTNTHSQIMVPHNLPLLPSLPNSHNIYPPRLDTNSIMRPHLFHSEQLQRPFLHVQEFRMEQLSMPELQKQQSNSEDVNQSHFNQSSYAFDHRPTSADNDTNCISKNGTPNSYISKEPTVRTGDAYDPLLDSINPDFQIHESCKADEVREAAVDAEVGIVENASPQMIVENSKGDVKESENETTKSKDSRSMKLFKSALADFVKEILRPSWRQGNISKEAFKTIVKKTVDKVAEAMPSSRIPKSQAKINQYVESSQQKLTKLVTGYVDKYVKM